MSVLIALGHKAQSGKDVAARYLEKRYEFRSLAFAEPLKRMVAAAFPGVTMDHLHVESLKMREVPFWPNESPARMCQRIAQGVRSEYGQDFWAQIAKRRLEAEGFFEPRSKLRFVITDMRTPAEAEMVKAWGGHAVKIFRDRALRGDIGRPEDHWTEIALDDFEGWTDVVVNNGTLAELHGQLDAVVHALGIDS